eukprot:744069-Alexandrium_andersonii.AAC.1
MRLGPAEELHRPRDVLLQHRVVLAAVDDGPEGDRLAAEVRPSVGPGLRQRRTRRGHCSGMRQAAEEDQPAE